jgi:glycosyltransferase involved in cell wall biosynthesis
MRSEPKRRLRVAFDHRIFSHQKHGGISRYFARVLQCLPEFGVDSKIISPLYQSEYLGGLPEGSVWGRPFEYTPKRLRAAEILGEALNRPLSYVYGADISHETYHHFRRIAPSKSRIVITVYDMIHEFFRVGDLHEYVRRNLTAAVARADSIICISESTRRDLLRFYPDVGDRAVVSHFGFDPIMGMEAGERPYQRPYLLYVGMRWNMYKNFHGLVEAYRSSPQLRSTFDLVFVGGGPFTGEERELLEAAGIADRAVQRSADDGALWRYYRHASAFVYPSLYEGFGIPPLEAMAADCPVVAMHVSSMPEVCGDAAEYAYPDQPGSLQAAIEKVVFSDRADALREAGRDRLKLFSWRKCAQEHADIYRGLV